VETSSALDLDPGTAQPVFRRALNAHHGVDQLFAVAGAETGRAILLLYRSARQPAMAEAPGLGEGRARGARTEVLEGLGPLVDGAGAGAQRSRSDPFLGLAQLESELFRAECNFAVTAQVAR
jgi:hypothetical protein